MKEKYWFNMEQNDQKLAPKFYASAEEQELARLKEAMNRTDEEKFLILTRLMKLGFHLREAKTTSIKIDKDSSEAIYIDFWKCLNKHEVRFILVGDFAVYFNGFERFNGDIDLYIDDTLQNRQRFRKAYADFGMGDYESIETMQFISGWVEFPIAKGINLDIQTSLKGVEVSFEECWQMAPIFTIDDVSIRFLHINHLLANKKAVKRPKDQMDVIELEKIKKLNQT